MYFCYVAETEKGLPSCGWKILGNKLNFPKLEKKKVDSVGKTKRPWMVGLVETQFLFFRPNECLLLTNIL